MQAYIEQIDGQFRNINIFTAWQGLEALGYETHFVSPDEVENLPLDANTPLVAGIPSIWQALRKLGVEVGALDAIPYGLHSFAGRHFGECSLSEIRARIASEGPPVFIKPRSQQGKLFNGHVVARFRDLIQTAHLPDELPVWWSDALDLRGEFRGFVLRGELVGLRHYFGDFRCNLNFDRIEAALQTWKSRPIACSMDWAFTESGETILIEVNDAYALGCYGLAPHFYAPMLTERWREIVQSGRTF